MLLSGDSGLIRVVNEAGLPQGSNVLVLFGATPHTALVNRMLNDVGTDPDSLPLMQHALLRIWQAASLTNRGRKNTVCLV
jgi:hypothetical protein